MTHLSMFSHFNCGISKTIKNAIDMITVVSICTFERKYNINSKL